MTWAPSGPNRLGLYSSQATNATTELTAVPTPSAASADEAKPWSPQNPLFWFAGVGLVTFGLMAASTTARVGKAKINLTVGDTK